MVGVLAAYILIQFIKGGLELANLRYLKSREDAVPPEYLGIVDEELLKKIKGYTLETGTFALVTSVFSSILVAVFMFGGVLDRYNSLILSSRLPFMAAGWLFFVLLYLADEIASIPFSLYHIFKIENRYGFNTTTPRLWITDLVKSLIISVVILSLVVVAALALVSYSPGRWWFWVWSFLLFFGLFVTYVSPYVVDPLFNRFSTLEDHELGRDIHGLADKAGIRIGEVLTMDQSKRSRHSNAYFAGIGKTKRIVLFDTLLESMDHPQIIAVLAHEMGHWKKRHILKSLIVMQCISFLALYTCFRLIDSGIFMTLFRISQPTFIANLLIAAFLGGMAFILIAPALNALSRYYERESDRYACDLTGHADALIGALAKLSKENLTNLYPHPLYAAIYYSHPPVLQRVEEIRRYRETER